MTRLDGDRLLLTRSAEDSAAWAAALEAEGAAPIVLPCIRTEPIAEPGLGERVRAALARADYLVVTSKRGAEICADLAGDSLPPALKLVAVGETTAQSLVAHFGRVDYVGSGTAADLGDALAGAFALDGRRCVLALAANAGDALASRLTKAGAEVERFDIYRTCPTEPTEPLRPLSALGCDAIVFASPTAVTGFANQVNVDLPAQIVTIGPSTSSAVREHGWPIAAEAKVPSLAGIIEAILETLHDRAEA